MSKTVGVVGLGIMGGAFARNLLASGFQVVGFDIDVEKAEAIASQGGSRAQSPGDVARQADIVITSLPSVAALHRVTAAEDGLAAAARRGLIVIECSTLPIGDKEAASDRLAQAGAALLDCPVSGTGAQAANKDLSVYASGDRQAVDLARPVFDGIARQTFFVGPFGNGSKLKFVANHLVHIHNVATAEAMVLGMKAGLEPQLIYDVIKAGAGGSRIFDLRGPMMVADEYLPATMKMALWPKDISVIDEFARELDCPIPLFRAGIESYEQALAKGLGDLDTAAVCRVLEEAAGVKR